MQSRHVIGSEQPGDAWRQVGYDVRFDCGAPGASRLSRDGGVVAVVDVLCFSTAVSVAVQRGINAVYPAPWAGTRAARLAGSVGAALAVARDEVTSERPWSLSPSALKAAPPVPRLVLPSVNGAAISSSLRGIGVAACLRNAGAVGSWLARRAIDAAHPVTVIAAGERWPNGALRPAFEDLVGAGAIIAALVARKTGLRLSHEAAAALALYSSTTSVCDAVRESTSGQELAERGYAEDVEMAVDVDADDVVPVFVEGAFRSMSPPSRPAGQVPATRRRPPEPLGAPPHAAAFHAPQRPVRPRQAAGPTPEDSVLDVRGIGIPAVRTPDAPGAGPAGPGVESRAGSE